MRTERVRDPSPSSSLMISNSYSSPMSNTAAACACVGVSGGYSSVSGSSVRGFHFSLLRYPHCDEERGFTRSPVPGNARGGSHAHPPGRRTRMETVHAGVDDVLTLRACAREASDPGQSAAALAPMSTHAPFASQ